MQHAPSNQIPTQPKHAHATPTPTLPQSNFDQITWTNRCEHAVMSGSVRRMWRSEKINETLQMKCVPESAVASHFKLELLRSNISCNIKGCIITAILPRCLHSITKICSKSKMYPVLHHVQFQILIGSSYFYLSKLYLVYLRSYQLV